MEATSSLATTSTATLPPTMEPKSEPETPWESIRNEELMESDFSIYDDLKDPYMFMCSRFQIKKDEEIRIAMAEHKKRSRNLTVSIYLSISFCFPILRFT